MKKLLGVALMLALCASSAFAAGSPQRAVGLRFGNWGVNGFEFSADTTFLNGAGVNTAALSNTDTTEALNLSWADWGMNTADPNGQTNVLRVWVSGDFISCDSVKIAIHQSYDKQHWFSATSPVSAGLQTQGVQTAFSAPFSFTPTPGFLTSPPAVAAMLLAPYARFEIIADGNTAARMAATKVTVVYGDVRDNPNPQPTLVCNRVQFGTYGPRGFTAEKDTASITFSAPDTTQDYNMQDWSFGAHGQLPAVADSLSSNATLAIVASDPSTLDSAYVLQSVSPDRIHWSNPALVGDANLYGRFSGPITTIVPTDLATGGTFAGFILNVGNSHPNLGNRTNGLGLTPFSRFIVRGPNGGEVMASAKCWLTYFRVPRK